LVTSKVSVWPDSSDGPRLMLLAKPDTVCVPEPSTTFWLGFCGRLKLGASLTAVRLMLSVLLSVFGPPWPTAPWSLANIVNCSEPLMFDAGVYCMLSNAWLIWATGPKSETLELLLLVIATPPTLGTLRRPPRLRVNVTAILLPPESVSVIVMSEG